MELYKHEDDVLMGAIPVRAVIGRNTRNNVNMFKLTHQKEGIFLPDAPVAMGDYLYNKNHDEKYLIVGYHQEYDGNRTLSIVTGMMLCEHSLTLESTRKTADNRGNIKYVPYSKYEDIACYVEFVGSGLRQHNPGLDPETEYKVYIADLTFNENEVIKLKGMKFDNDYTIISVDYVSYTGIAVLEIKRKVV